MPANWPTRTDYGSAIQNPKNCFESSMLKSGTAKTNSLGLPIGASGAYAIVYELKVGKEKHAIRCFTHPITNQEARYKALSQFLSSVEIDSLVGFEYLSQGIKVNGRLYPVLRMEWVNGLLLTDYIKANLKNRKRLSELAKEWIAVVSELKKNGVAHGDMQHGNIIIQNNGKIRFVDYDSFYIPSLRNNAPEEAGHANYQHPERIQTGCYDENIDNFSSFVIYLSLHALIVDNRLWQKFNDGGDNLIFSSNDFKNPGKTPIWNELRKTRDARIIDLTDKLEFFCKEPISNIPHLEAVLEGKTIIKPAKHQIPIKPIKLKPSIQKPQLPRIKVPELKIPELSKPKEKRPVLIKPEPESSKPLFWLKNPVSTTIVNTAKKCTCGYLNKANEIYCQKCARTLLTGNSWCSACETPVPRFAVFCTRCGVAQ
jgi:serine/threonine protein kinase